MRQMLISVSACRAAISFPLPLLLRMHPINWHLSSASVHSRKDPISDICHQRHEGAPSSKCIVYEPCLLSSQISAPHLLLSHSPEIAVSLPCTVGWILFLIFAGVGVFGAPIDWIQQFLGRPTSTITKSEYMRRARIIAQRSREVLVSACRIA